MITEDAPFPPSVKLQGSPPPPVSRVLVLCRELSFRHAIADQPDRYSTYCMSWNFRRKYLASNPQVLPSASGDVCQVSRINSEWGLQAADWRPRGQPPLLMQHTNPHLSPGLRAPRLNPTLSISFLPPECSPPFDITVSCWTPLSMPFFT
jgi:hypothetical protein